MIHLNQWLASSGSQSHLRRSGRPSVAAWRVIRRSHMSANTTTVVHIQLYRNAGYAYSLSLSLWYTNNGTHEHTLTLQYTYILPDNTHKRTTLFRNTRCIINTQCAAISDATPFIIKSLALVYRNSKCCLSRGGIDRPTRARKSPI